ncbi:MAG: PD-(D/E)XK nuclease family protein [Endomicrobiaceae bacterium]
MRDNSFKISYSRISAYLFCPEKYRLIYVENKYIPLNAGISFGLSIHRTLENFYKNNLNTYESMVESLNSSWESSGYGSPQDVYANYLKALAILKNYWETYGKQKAKNILTEKNFHTEIGEFPFIGIIDRIDENEDGTRELVDYKTHKEIWSKETVDKDLQLSLYCYACKKALGFIPERIAIYFLSHNKKIYTERGENEIQQAIETSVSVANKIMNKEFMPDISKCFFCDFKKICNYSVAKQTEESS